MVSCQIELQESDDVDDPLIVLLDLNMPPKMGGAEAAETIRKMMDNEELERYFLPEGPRFDPR